MEFTLKKTDVFEDWYNPKLSYKLSVVFSSRLNHDNRMKEFYAKIPLKETQGDYFSEYSKWCAFISIAESNRCFQKIIWFMWNLKVCYQKIRSLQFTPLCQIQT